MSGALTTGLGVVDAARGVGGFLGITDPAVQLGPVAFDGFEVPESIGWGGEQSVHVHKLPGGIRVVDAMGPDPAPISWRGIFLGAGAQARAQRLDALWRTGEQVDLQWGGFVITVVVTGFKGDYRRSSHIPYEVTCTVVADDAGVGGGLFDVLGGALSTGLQVAADVGAAVGMVSGLTGLTLASAPALAGAVAGIGSALGVAAGAVGLAGNFSLGAAATNVATAALGTAQGLVSDGLAMAGDALGVVASAAPVGSLVADAGALLGAVDTANVAAGLAATQGFVGRAVVNAAVGSV